MPYIINDDQGSAIFAADSGRTMRLWEIGYQSPALHAVFLEASFPNRMTAIAEESFHLAPSMLGCGVAKLPPGVGVFAFHLKVSYQDEIRDEPHQLGRSQLKIGQCEREHVL